MNTIYRFFTLTIFAAISLLVPGMVFGATDTLGSGQSEELVVLVLPFENLSRARSMVNYEVMTGSDPDRPKRTFRIDRYSEAPRAILEDIMGGMDGIRIVERQRVDSILLEAEFGRLSGLVDTAKAVKIGKMLGANRIILGSILDVSERKQKFSGYGIRTETVQAKSSVRVRMIDPETGTVRPSKIFEGSETFMSSQYGGVSDSDVAYAVIKAALEQIRRDTDFHQALQAASKSPSTSVAWQVSQSGLTAQQLASVEVDFAPKPDNCDIELDGRYIGGSPLKRTLPADKTVKVRISKAGYHPWEREITPESGLRVTPELAPLVTEGEKRP